MELLLLSRCETLFKSRSRREMCGLVFPMATGAPEMELGFKRPEMHSEKLAGTVAWIEVVGGWGLDVLAVGFRGDYFPTKIYHRYIQYMIYIYM